MAASSKKLKGSKDGEKKQAKKVEEEVVEQKEDRINEVDLTSPSAEEPITTSVVDTPAPNPVYEEPVLTQLIVSRFVGVRI